MLASDWQCNWSKCRERAQQALAAAICAVLVLTGCVAASSDSERPELMVFAAVSLGDALGELATSFEGAAGIRPVLNLAGSNVLGQQLLASPVADVFLSADPRWVDRLEEDDLIAPGSRRAFLSNRLVVVAHPDSETRLTRVSDLATANFRFLSLGDPAGVPAGRYAKRALQQVRIGEGDLWQRVRARVAPAPDVRAALGMVGSTPETLGIVYASDVVDSANVRMLLELAEVDPPIRYVAAAIRGRPRAEAIEQFLDYLSSPTATSIFEKHGFEALP